MLTPTHPPSEEKDTSIQIFGGGGIGPLNLHSQHQNNNIHITNNHLNQQEEESNIILNTPMKFPTTSSSSSTKTNISSSTRTRTDAELETVLINRIKKRVCAFGLSLLVVFVFCSSLAVLTSFVPNIQFWVNCIFVVYFAVVGSFLVWSLKGSFVELRKLREIRKKSGILPKNYKKLEAGVGFDIDDIWSKWD